MAVLGLGRVGPAHARAVSQTPGVELKLVADVDDSRVRQVLADLPHVAGCSAYQAALTRDDIHVVVICLPHRLHEEAAIAAARAGKHILIEKPLADSVAGCDRIIEAADRAGVVLMPAHTMHYHAVVRGTKEIIDSGEVGDLFMALDLWHQPFIAGPAWTLNRAMGGGMGLLRGVHLIDRLLWIIGSDIRSVSAMVGHPINPDGRADDTGMAFLRWRSGRVATISHCAYRQGVPVWGGDFFCTNGQVRFRVAYYEHGETGVWIGQDHRYRRVEVPEFDPLRRQFAEFMAAVKKGGEPPITAGHGRRVMEVLEAIERSSEIGREVLLE